MREKVRYTIFMSVVFIQFSVYKVIEHIIHPRYMTKIWIDNTIPFIPSFILFYYMFYILMFIPFVLSYKNSGLFVSFAIIYIVVTALLGMFFISIPTMVERPELAINGVSTKAISFIYSIDAPYNTFPSGHVTFMTLSNLLTLKVNKRAGYILIPISICVILSTLFVKQHYILDVIAGLFLAIASYIIYIKFIYPRWADEYI